MKLSNEFQQAACDTRSGPPLDCRAKTRFVLLLANDCEHVPCTYGGSR